MTRYIALLRAVNVGGTDTLRMSDLRAICEEAGFTGVETYTASGNAVFDGRASAARVKSELERRLKNHAGKSIGVIERSASEMVAVLEANPFPNAEGKYTYAFFLDEPPPRDSLAHVTDRKDEQVRLGKREVYVSYGSGMGRSKLRIPAAKGGTARNMNTIAKLVQIASGPGKR
jgi:uncharacterized protein (DUF1697 family)